MLWLVGPFIQRLLGQVTVSICLKETMPPVLCKSGWQKGQESPCDILYTFCKHCCRRSSGRVVGLPSSALSCLRRSWPATWSSLGRNPSRIRLRTMCCEGNVSLQRGTMSRGTRIGLRGHGAETTRGSRLLVRSRRRSRRCGPMETGRKSNSLFVLFLFSETFA